MLFLGAVGLLVKRWNPWVLEYKATGESAICSLIFSNDDEHISAGLSNGRLTMLEKTSGKVQIAKGQNEGRVIALSYSPSGKSVASGTDIGELRIWNSDTGLEEQVLRGHSSWITTMSFAMDGLHLASISFDGTVRVWEIASGKEVFKEKCSEVRFSGVGFSLDSKVLMAMDLKEKLYYWNWRDASVASRPNDPEGKSYSGAISADQTRAVVCGSDVNAMENSAKIFDLETKKEVYELGLHDSKVTIAKFSHNGANIATGTSKGSIYLWRYTHPESRTAIFRTFEFWLVIILGLLLIRGLFKMAPTEKVAAGN